MKNLADRTKGLFAPKVGETKTGGDIRVGLFPGGDIFAPGTENAPKVAGGVKINFATAEPGSGFRPTRMPIISPYIPRMPQGAAKIGSDAAGWGKAAPPVRLGMRTMLPKGPPPGATIFDPREEMIEAAQMSRMGPTPFGPGATIYRPEIPEDIDRAGKFLSGYGAFTDVGKMGFVGKAAIGIGLGVTLVTLLNLGAKR